MDGVVDGYGPKVRRRYQARYYFKQPEIADLRVRWGKEPKASRSDRA